MSKRHVIDPNRLLLETFAIIFSLTNELQCLSPCKMFKVNVHGKLHRSLRTNANTLRHKARGINAHT